MQENKILLIDVSFYKLTNFTNKKTHKILSPY